LKDYANRIKSKLLEQPAASVTVLGYAADPPGSTERGQAELSALRAQAVADALRAGGVGHHIDAIGGGAAPGMSAMSTGTFDEIVAKQMRRVEITY
jgi:outer membrane protein OmpA-like peptidoglycan-associated protein